MLHDVNLLISIMTGRQSFRFLFLLVNRLSSISTILLGPTIFPFNYEHKALHKLLWYSCFGQLSCLVHFELERTKLNWSQLLAPQIYKSQINNKRLLRWFRSCFLGMIVTIHNLILWFLKKSFIIKIIISYDY